MGKKWSTKWREKNQAHWDERVPIHLNAAAYGVYDVASFKAGRSTLESYELEDLGPVVGKELVHLQCHFGLDTLSWARLGTRVTGLDFSPPAIAAAKQLAEETGLMASFVVANVYDATAVLGKQFNIVYTGIGVLCWLPDIPHWARVVASLLQPGGLFYLTEFHPTEWIFAEYDLTVEYDYFTPLEGLRVYNTGSYASPSAATQQNETVQWNHNLGEVVTALIQAGLEIQLLREHDSSVIQRWPFLERSADGRYRMPKGRPSVPLLYTLRAVKRQT